MKKTMHILTMLLALAMSLTLFVSCDSENPSEPQVSDITISQWLDAKGEIGPWQITATVKTVVNPALAIITDDSGAEVNLFGVYEDGEFRNFTDLDIVDGDIIIIADGKYNEFEGSVEISEAKLVDCTRIDRKPEVIDYIITGQNSFVIENESYNWGIVISGENGKIVFNNCTFSEDVTLYGGADAKVVLNNCSFENGAKCVIISDFEEATLATLLPKFMMFCTVANVTIKKAGAVISSADKILNVNGTEYAIANATLFINSTDSAENVVAYEGQNADMHNVSVWKENGEQVIAHTAIKDVG